VKMWIIFSWLVMLHDLVGRGTYPCGHGEDRVILWARHKLARGVCRQDGRVAMRMHTVLLLNTIPVSDIDPLQVTHVLCVCSCN
jgi:hypothetical protein